MRSTISASRVSSRLSSRGRPASRLVTTSGAGSLMMRGKVASPFSRCSVS